MSFRVLLELADMYKKSDIEITWLLHNPKEVVFDVAGLKSVHRRTYSSEYVIVTVDSKTTPEST